MAGCIADFFITNESISNAIENLKRLKQGNRMVEDYWMDFCVWKDLTQYNEIALVGIFRDGLNKGLARKLVELGQLNEMSSLDIWYIKAVEFERARRSAEGIFGQRRQFIEEKRIM